MLKLIDAIQRQLEIRKVRTTAYHPQTDGLTERCNRTLVEMVSKYVNTQQNDWDEILPYMVFAYNTSRHASTNFTPFFLLHGREAKLPIDQLIPPLNHPPTSQQQYVQQMVQRLQQTRQLASDAMQRAHTRQVM